MKNAILKITVITLLLGFIFTKYSVKGKNRNEIDNLPVNSEIPGIGSRLELFTYNFLNEKLNNFSQKLHEPIDKVSVLKFDNLWEGPFSAY